MPSFFEIFAKIPFSLRAENLFYIISVALCKASRIICSLFPHLQRCRMAVVVNKCCVGAELFFVKATAILAPSKEIMLAAPYIISQRMLNNYPKNLPIISICDIYNLFNSVFQ